MIDKATSLAADAAEARVEQLADSAQGLLIEMLRFKSLSGEEQGVQEHLASWLDSRGIGTRLEPVDSSIEQDPNYSHHPHDGSHAPNLVAALPAHGSGRSLVLNSHTDIVPVENPEMYSPRIDGDRITCRGAADAKGQVVTWVLAMLAVKEAGIALAGKCVGTSVVEEEVGGNGALAYCLSAKPSDIAVVLEPADFGIHPSNRGAVWFKVTTEGIPTHMGRWWEGQSAFENLEKLLVEIRKWDARLVEESKGVPLFPDDPSPVHVNLGIVQAGDWPSKVPATAMAEGGVGFLPNKPIESIKSEMVEVVERAAKQHGFPARVVFEKLQNDAYATPPDHPGVAALAQAATHVRGTAEVTGFPASCDARLFYHRGNMPTIVFGPGTLLMAHADTEHILMSEIVTAARILARFIVNWCGVA